MKQWVMVHAALGAVAALVILACVPLASAVPPSASFTWQPVFPQPGEAVTFDGSASSDDGSIVSYSWSYQAGAMFPHHMGTGEILEYTWEREDTYNVTLQVEDDDGDMDSVCHPIVVDGTAPSLVLLHPQPGLYLFDKKLVPLSTRVIALGPLTLSVAAEDSGAGIHQIMFLVDGEEKAADTTPPYKWTWNERVSGRHTLAAAAYDNAGNTASIDIPVLAFNWLATSPHSR